MTQELDAADGAVRLQKVLAAAGVGSRRACEALIADGRVSVDGLVVEQMGRRVDPATAVVHVDGRRVIVRADLQYLAVNKPRGVLSAMSDDRGRRTLTELLADADPAVDPAGLFHVGRLDADSEGLLLLTNDGDLAHRLMHPSFGVPKTYLATVPGPVHRDVRRRLLAGIELDDGAARADSFRVVQTAGERAIVEIVLHEGRKHIVRRLLDALGHPVSRLVRTAIGPVRLGSQRVGTVRALARDELGDLHGAIEEPSASADAPAAQGRSRL